jgi:hypothetical protein
MIGNWGIGALEHLLPIDQRYTTDSGVAFNRRLVYACATLEISVST